MRDSGASSSSARSSSSSLMLLSSAVLVLTTAAAATLSIKKLMQIQNENDSKTSNAKIKSSPTSKSRSSNPSSSSSSPPYSKSGIMETLDAIANGRMQEFLIEEHQKTGSDVYRLKIPMWDLPPMVAVVASPEDCRAIYKDELTIKPKTMYSFMNKFTSGWNIVNISQGQEWYHRRKGVNPAFASKHIKRMNEIASKNAENWINNILLPMIESSSSFNVGNEMIYVTMSVICQAAFEYNISREESDEILQSIKLGWAEFSNKSCFQPWRLVWGSHYFLKERKEAFVAVERLRQFAIQIMDQYRRNPAQRRTPDTVIDCIMKNPNYKSDQERIPDIIMMVGAGHDTTGFTLAFALLELAKNPTEQQKLRNELLKKDNNNNNNNKEGDETEQRQQQYLMAVITETLRCHPVVPVTGFKQLGRNYTTHDSRYTLPKGTLVFLAQIAISRDSSIFEQPDEFIPSRWLPANVNDKMKQAWFPFSLGNRNCVGQPLAIAELRTFLSKLIQDFEFTVEKEGDIVVPSTIRLENCHLKAKKI